MFLKVYLQVFGDLHVDLCLIWLNFGESCIKLNNTIQLLPISHGMIKQL